MAKLLVLDAAAAAFIADCLEVGCEGAPDDAVADLHSPIAHEVVRTLRGMSADESVQLEILDNAELGYEDDSSSTEEREFGGILTEDGRLIRD